MKIKKSVPVEIEITGADGHECSAECAFCKGGSCTRYHQVVMGYRDGAFVSMARCNECLQEFGVTAECDDASIVD